MAADARNDDDLGRLSPVAAARDALAQFVEAAEQTYRIEAMQAAARVELVSLAVDVALRSAEAFTSPRLAAAERREMAQRAVIAELAVALRVPERSMMRVVSDAHVLTTALPATLAAMRRGELSIAHARVVIDETVDLGDRPQLCARLDEALALAACDVTAATLRRRAKRLREQLEVETIDQRFARAIDARRIELEPAADGMAWLHVLLAASDAHLVMHRVGAIAAESVAESADARTPAQVRADVARDVLLEGLPPLEHPLHGVAGRVRPTVHVTVPVLTLLGAGRDGAGRDGVDDEPASLQGYGPIDTATARRLAAGAPSFTRLLTHPVDGTVLDVDRTVYRVLADLKRWLEVRDETCRFPGCARAATGCDVDHTVDWADGGRTAERNLAHLCRRHHRLKHETSWSVRQADRGVLEWTSMTGRRHRTEPADPVRRGAQAPSATRAAGMTPARGMPSRESPGGTTTLTGAQARGPRAGSSTRIREVPPAIDPPF